MKLIIAGSRDIFLSEEELFEIVDKLGILYRIREIVSGHASGVDSSGERFAREYGIKLKVFEADWQKYGGLAGPRRNREMAEYSEALLLIWDGKSRGSANMKARMAGLKKPIYEVIRCA